MRVLIIDPVLRTTTSRDLGETTRTLGLLGRHRVSARLPNRDLVLSSRGALNDEGFSMGGSVVIAGIGVVVGRKDETGRHTSARSDPETISALVRWAAVPRKDEASDAAPVRALRVDPEAETVEEVAIVPCRTEIDRMLGGRSRFAMKVSRDDAVFVAVDAGRRSRIGGWRKDGLAFRGLSLVIGADADGTLKDAATDVDDMRSSVVFELPGAPVGRHAAKPHERAEADEFAATTSDGDTGLRRP